jgi:hypothetical protein
MTNITITITGLEPIIKGLGEIGAAKWMKQLLLTSAKAIKGRAGIYPAEKSPRYDRGWGPIYPSGKKGKKTSQNMRGQWNIVSLPFNAQVENTATYSEFVIGQRQASFHARRGWHRIVDEANAEAKNLEWEIDRKIESLFPK